MIINRIGMCFLVLVVSSLSYASEKESGGMEKSGVVKKGKVEFLAIVKPGSLKIRGESNEVSGSVKRLESGISGEFQVLLKTINAGEGMTTRTEHLHNLVFELKGDEISTFKISELKILPNVEGKQKNVPFRGKLNFHGVEKELNGTAELELSAKKVHFEAHFKVLLSDYKVPPVKYTIMKVQDEVEVTVTGDANF